MFVPLVIGPLHVCTVIKLVGKANGKIKFIWFALAGQYPPWVQVGNDADPDERQAVLQKIVKIGNAVPMQDSRNNRKTEHKKRADYRIFAGNNGITYRLQ